MLLSFSTLRGHKMHATDGDVGSVKDVYFDDASWMVRYLVVDAGTWLAGRSVLLVPGVLGSSLKEGESVPVRLSKEQIRRSPDIDTQKPVSRQHEEALHSYYGWPPYWGPGSVMGTSQTAGVGPGIAGIGVPAEILPPERERTEESGAPEGPADIHLRSADELDGYHIHALDGEIGSVADFIVDEGDWRIRYLVVKTGGWFSGDRVLIPPTRIRQISWEESTIYVNVDRKTIADSPPFDGSQALTRAYEEQIDNHYSRPHGIS